MQLQEDFSELTSKEIQNRFSFNPGLAAMSLLGITIASYSYVLVENALNFTAAQSYCQEQLGTDLASIHSETEYDELIASISSSAHYLGDGVWIGGVWIGLNRLNTNDDQTWEWTDGSPWDWGTNVSGGVYPWIDFEPNNKGGSEKCVTTAAWNDFKSKNWNDLWCSYEKYFLCAIGQTQNSTGTVFLCKDCHSSSLPFFRATNRNTNTKSNTFDND